MSTFNVNLNEEKSKSPYLNERKKSIPEHPNLGINYGENKKRNNRYIDKSLDRDVPTLTPKNTSYQTNIKKMIKIQNIMPKRTAHSVEKSQNRSPLIKDKEKFNNIFEKNQNYIKKNKFNYEETMKKISDYNINEINTPKIFSPNGMSRNKAHDPSKKDFLFMNSPFTQKNDNYEQSLEKIDLLYKKNDMAIRDYIKIKDNLNIVCLVIFY